MQSLRKSSLCVIGLLATGLVGHAATLESYFDFTQYGTVTGGSQITSNVYGDAVATVKSTATSLTSGGLAITAGTNAGSTGVTLAGSELASFTGDFTFQIWFTSPATVAGNTALFGGTTSATIDTSMVGNQALFAGYSNTNPRFLRPIMSNNTQFGVAATAPTGTAATASTLYNYTITYVASSDTVQAYLNGAVVGGSISTNYSTGLSGLTNGFSIGGVASPAFNDNAAGVTISSSLFYTGALTSTEIANIHAFGADVTVNELISAGVTATPVPEPSAFAALAGVVGLGFAAARRRRVAA
jgi:hypothetical protein